MYISNIDFKSCTNCGDNRRSKEVTAAFCVMFGAGYWKTFQVSL